MRRRRWASAWASALSLAASASGQDVIDGHAAIPTLARLEFDDRGAQVIRSVIGPIDVLEDQLGVGALPQQEVREPALVAGADDEVGRVRRRGRQLPLE